MFFSKGKYNVLKEYIEEMMKCGGLFIGVVYSNGIVVYVYWLFVGSC